MIPGLDGVRWMAQATVFAVAVAFSGLAGAQETFHYNAETVDTAAHWAARSTLANALMFSGVGEPVEVSMTELDTILKHAGYTLRPAMPDMAIVGPLYAAGDPAFVTAPDFGDPKTLRWNPETFDRTLDPEAQAWSIIKSTAPNFHLNFHESKDERRVALMMLPQAREQAETLAERLRNPDGLFAARSPEGEFADPRPGQQAAVLWAAANMLLAATIDRDDYWHQAARDLLDPEPARALGDAALAALEALPPETAVDRAIAIEALGRYALAAEEIENRRRALELARRHAGALKALPPDAGLKDLGFAVYGLNEAGRLFPDRGYRDAAAEIFRARLVPLWDEAIGAFRAPAGDVVYTPRTLAALVAGLNALRWYGPDEVAQEGARLYPQLFETVMVRAGMLLSSPLPLVPQSYVDREPAAHFAHPALPKPAEAGLAPVFAAEVRNAGGSWNISDRTFRTADALLLANMLVKPHEGEADAFLPEGRLTSLR